MKRQLKNKYQGTKFQAVPKHSGTYPFHPGNAIALDEIPAYHSSGLKTYVRHLRPVRNQKDIDVRLLSSLINKRINGNHAEIIPGGIKLNQFNIKIKEGLAICDGLRFRFSDLREFLLELRKERILLCDIEDIRVIKLDYFKQ